MLERNWACVGLRFGRQLIRRVREGVRGFVAPSPGPHEYRSPGKARRAAAMGRGPHSPRRSPADGFMCRDGRCAPPALVYAVCMGQEIAYTAPQPRRDRASRALSRVGGVTDPRPGPRQAQVSTAESHRSLLCRHFVLESKPQFARFLLLCSTAISEALNGIHN